ncbi:hypothetical protein Aperf_G00000042588 [Anoplocephala perfoliata]
MKITILYQDKKLFNVNMHGDMSVGRLREIIEEIRYIPKDKQTLTFNGYMLEDGKLLMQDYGVTDQSKITLSLPLNFESNIKIYVKVPGGVVIKRIIQKSELVSSLKWSIEDATKIPADEQALSYGSWLMEDNMKLGEYNLQHGSLVRVLRRPNHLQVTESSPQILHIQSAKKSGDEKLSSRDGSVRSKTESVYSRMGSVAEEAIPKRPLPIKRLEITKIPVTQTGETKVMDYNEMEKIKPTPKPESAPLTEKMRNGESLRLNLPDTEIYRNFRQVLGEQMAQSENES